MLSNHLQIEMLSIAAFKLPERKLRKHSRSQVRKIMVSIERFGMNVPLLVDENGEIIAGAATFDACRRLGMEAIPAIRITHLSGEEKRLFRIAHNRIGEDAGWDTGELRIELEELSVAMPELDLTLSGFEISDIDRMLGNDGGDLSALDTPVEVEENDVAVTQRGDLWIIGQHRLLCGDATDLTDMGWLMQGDKARIWLTDPPYNVPISGHVSGLGKHKHREFAMAAGEMSVSEFEAFLASSIEAASTYLIDGGLFYMFMDSQHLIDLELAARAQGLRTLTICVWVKDNAGMGSFYRSAHELVLVAKRACDTIPHVNAIELGKHGRYRSNVWRYAGVNSFGKGRDEALAMHPTVKPVTMVADAILDASLAGEIVLDSFGGSGSTMVAAEKTGRRGRVMELDPLYCDAIIRRMEAAFGIAAIHAESGTSFTDLALTRATNRPRPLQQPNQKGDGS